MDEEELKSISPNQLLSKYGIDSTNMTYKQQIKVLRDLRVEKSVDLDILELKHSGDAFFKEYQKLQIEIYNVSSCIMQVKEIYNYRKKEQTKKLMKKMMPIKKN